MEFKKVKEKYPDSLSQYNFEEIFNNPEHGSLNFSDIKEQFEEFYNVIFELEKLDYKLNLYQEEINLVDTSRNQLISFFNQIQNFNIQQTNSVNLRQSIVTQITNEITVNSKILDDILIKIKTKNFFASSKGNKEYKVIIEEKEKIIQIRKELEIAKKEIDNEIKNINSLKNEVIEKDEKAGIGKNIDFFRTQSEYHRKKAECNNNSENWLKKRKLYIKYIGIFLFSVLLLYFISFLFSLSDYIYFKKFTVENWKSFWNIRIGLLLVSILGFLYTGLYFNSKNYSKEKELEYQNKHKYNISETMGLLSSGKNDNLRSIIYLEGVKEIFSNISGGGKNIDSIGQNIKLDIPNIKNSENNS